MNVSSFSIEAMYIKMSEPIFLLPKRVCLLTSNFSLPAMQFVTTAMLHY